MRHAITAIVTLVVVSVVALCVAGPAAAASSQRRGSYAPHIDRHIVPTRAENHGSQLATWYGPGFFGNGTACGQTLRPDTWGIAHRTLPCGTLVTLSHRGRSVTVRVIDRGPYSGATVDLTSRTKHYLRFAAGRVRMVRVKRYRVLPRPKPVAGVVALHP